jgi:hypothetical protein
MNNLKRKKERRARKKNENENCRTNKKKETMQVTVISEKSETLLRDDNILIGTVI